MGPYVVGVDVGGTAIKAGLFDADLRLLAEFRTPTPRDAGPDAVLTAVLGAVTDTAAGGERRFGAAPAAVGLAVLGLIDETAGVAVMSAAAGWRDVPLRALAEQAAGVPVGFGHDIRAAALAEVLAGCAATFDPAAVVLGGGLAKSGDLLLTPLRAALAARSTLGPPPPVTVATLGDRAALVGAGLLASRVANIPDGRRS